MHRNRELSFLVICCGHPHRQTAIGDQGAYCEVEHVVLQSLEAIRLFGRNETRSAIGPSQYYKSRGQ